MLEQAGRSVRETTDATKVRQGRDEAVALARKCKNVVYGRGKNVTVLDIAKDAPDDDALAKVLLGPTGNLKAPTLRVGDTLLVGFNALSYAQVLGKPG